MNLRFWKEILITLTFRAFLIVAGVTIVGGLVLLYIVGVVDFSIDWGALNQ